MSQIFVPRVGGGTLILTIGTSTPQTPVSTLVTFRDGASKVTHRDGVATGSGR